MQNFMEIGQLVEKLEWEDAQTEQLSHQPTFSIN
jgi:hypothetical protein